MTQKQLVGGHITRNMLSKIENDSATPSMRTLEYLAKRLEVSPAWLMQGAEYSDGTSPDGLDAMRAAYREGRYRDCLELLEKATTSGTTDEGYLLRARASLAAAREALDIGDWQSAKEYAGAADYYNQEGIYYSPETDAEMSLVLAECALMLDISEFEENIADFERAQSEIAFTGRYDAARAEYLLKTGEWELAEKLLDSMSGVSGRLEAKTHYLRGLCLLEKGDLKRAEAELLSAEETSAGLSGGVLQRRVFEALEECYMRMEDFKAAHSYAARQIDREIPLTKND